MRMRRGVSGLLAGVVLFVGAQRVGAQGTGVQEDPRTKAREAWIAHLQTELTLTEQQVKDVRGVLETLKPGELTGGDAGVLSPEALAERRERGRQAIQKIDALLTPDQRTRWAQMREKRRQEHAAPAPASPRD